MWARLSVLMLAAACYAPKALPGTPCTPSLANCPSGQQCALVGGEHVCVEELPPTDSSAGIDMLPPDVPSDGVRPAWSLVQTRGRTGNDTPITTSTAGSLIVVGVETPDVVPVDGVTDDANNVYVRVPGTRAVNVARNLGVELWYAKAASAGATRVTATGLMVYAIVAWEVAGLDPLNPLGSASKLDDRPATTTPLGAAITTTTAGELVISIAIVANQVSGLTAGSAFTNDQTTFGNGWAHLTDNKAPAGTYQAQWEQPNLGPYCATSASFRLAP